MHKEFLMGNEAIAAGARAAGVNLVCGYPGTPSTEVLEATAKNNKDGKIYVEWSVNEKAAMELGAGASYSGARVMVTMKQVGLNVASDPLMSLEYVGIKGAMVIMVADDPGPISSQTEQDTRSFAAFSKLPCFDPSSVAEAYEMIIDAFEYSEKYGTPVFFRPTTRVCHGYASIDVRDDEECAQNVPEGFIKDLSRWVIFPKLSFKAHADIEKRNELLGNVFSAYKKNIIHSGECGSKIGIATHGISYTYTMEALKGKKQPRIFKVSTPFPFPEEQARLFLDGLDEVLCIEELDPVIERELTYICGKYNLNVKIRGKLTGDIAPSGENSCGSVLKALSDFMGFLLPEERQIKAMPPLPVRPPVLCAGCPHRASFFAVKEAMKGKKTIFCGDIGCYTLGNAMPLDMVDTCLCMGAGVNIAQGVGKIEPDTVCFSFVGDSTFFASAITGVVNAVYNRANMTLIVLDNSTTAMTGHQPHPGTGRTAMGDITEKINIEAILRGVGVKTVETVNPFDLEKAVRCVKRVAAEDGVKAIIFRSPCAVLIKPERAAEIDKVKCIGCKKCINTLGCPGIALSDNGVIIDSSLCTGCGLCTQVCPTNAIKAGGKVYE